MISGLGKERSGHKRGAPKIGEARPKTKNAESQRKWKANMTPERYEEYLAKQRAYQAKHRAANREKVNAGCRDAYYRRKARDATPGFIEGISKAEEHFVEKGVEARMRVLYKS